MWTSERWTKSDGQWKQKWRRTPFAQNQLMSIASVLYEEQPSAPKDESTVHEPRQPKTQTVKISARTGRSTRNRKISGAVPFAATCTLQSALLQQPSLLTIGPCALDAAVHESSRAERPRQPQANACYPGVETSCRTPRSLCTPAHFPLTFSAGYLPLLSDTPTVLAPDTFCGSTHWSRG